MARSRGLGMGKPQVSPLASGRDDKGRGVTFRKISDLEGQSYESVTQSDFFGCLLRLSVSPMLMQL
jgi:hypothetical protein